MATATETTGTDPRRVGGERLRPWHWGVLVLLFLVSRLFHLSLFPLFVDEGMYLLFAEELLQGVPAGWGDGKPLEGVAIAACLVLGFEPVLAARLPHVAAGLLTFLAIGAFGARFLSRRAAVASMLLWTCLPYPLFFERLATPDAMLAGGGMASLYLGVCLAIRRRSSPVLAWSTGGVTAAAMLFKMPVSFFFLLAPALAWLFSARPAGRSHRDLARALAPPVLLLLAIGATAGVRFYLGLHPVGFGLAHLAKGSLGGGWSGLSSTSAGNLSALGRYFLAYLGLPLTVCLGVALVLALARGRAKHRYLATLGGLYLAAFLLGAKLMFPRYLLPALPPLVLLMGWATTGTLARVAQAVRGGRSRRVRRVRAVLDSAAVVLLLWLTLPFALTLVTEPHALRLPHEDRFQYVEGWPSGFGFRAVARYLGEALEKDPAATAIVLHVADGARLRAYEPSGVLDSRLEQIQIAARRTLPLPQQVQRLERRVAASSRAYVVVGRRSTWSVGFSAGFSDAVEAAVFPRPSGGQLVPSRRGAHEILILAIDRDATWRGATRR